MKVTFQNHINTTRREQASALVIVLWVSFGLVSAALYFGHSMSFEIRAAAGIESSAQADQAGEGAARYVAYLLENLEEQGKLPALEEYQNEAATVGLAYFWLVGRDNDFPDGAEPSFGLIDEAGKLNLNATNLTTDMLMNLPNMTEQLAAAIIDWRDDDDEITENGAEIETYGRFTSPYNTKNTNFNTLEEIRLLNGADKELLLGEDWNRNGVLDPNENDGSATLPDDDQDGQLDFGLMEYFTVWSRQPNSVLPDGTNLVFIGQSGTGGGGGQGQGGGTGGSADLTALLQDKLGEERANSFGGIANRTYNSVLEFYRAASGAGMTLDEFALIDDALTAVNPDDQTEIIGLINVNTAPAAVLVCIPGLEQTDADSLVAWRQSNTESLNTVGWVTQVLDQELDSQIGPYITDRGYQYTADISAIGNNGRGYRRSLFVFDTSSTNGVTALYRREMSRAGWALGADLRHEIALLRSDQL